MANSLEATALEWPRFCYAGNPSLFEDHDKKRACLPPKKNKRKLTSAPSRRKTSRKDHHICNSLSDNESISSGKDEEQLVPNLPQAGQDNHRIRPPLPQPFGEFVFSDLMRQMARKYQERGEQEHPIGAAMNPQHHHHHHHLSPFPIKTAALAASLGPYFNPLAARILPTSSGIEYLFQNSPALTALACRKRSSSPASTGDDYLLGSVVKHQKLEDPLDLSSARLQQNEEEVDVLSVDPPVMIEDDPESWNVQQVVEFVSQIDTCQEYTEVFQQHSIDGSALLELTEAHLTGILGMKLGPAIKLRNSIRDLQKRPQSSSSSTYSA